MSEVRVIGHVGVDSGQILICDPCYIDGEWQKEDFEDVRIYKHLKDGVQLQYRIDFEHYQQIVEPYGKTMNEMIESNEVEQIASPPSKTSFSYNACCKQTLSEDGYGQLNYKLGHPGVGVVTTSGYGDGYYPVKAKIVDGRIKKIWVEFF